jgi:hypothetical protein
LLPEVEALARQWMEQAEALAVATLRNERDLFERCVAELIGKGSLGMKELEGLLVGMTEPTM